MSPNKIVMYGGLDGKEIYKEQKLPMGERKLRYNDNNKRLNNLADAYCKQTTESLMSIKKDMD